MFVILAIGGINLIAQDTEPDETIKVNTEFVSVPVIVTDREGHYIPGLKESDFGILQDGIEQPIEFFGSTDEPLTIALLIDTSHSTRPVLDDIKDAARSLIKLLSPQDQAMIVCFDRGTHILSPLTHDQEKLRKAIKDAEIPDAIGTTLRDAVFETVFTSFAGLTGRKAIILLTDGRDGGSHISGRNLLIRLQETDTLIYSVQFLTDEKLRIERMLKTGTIPRPRRVFKGDPNDRSTKNAELEARAKGFLQDLAMVSAGRSYVTQSGKLKNTFELIVDELRRQYRLGFYAPESNDNNAIHEVRVRIARPNLIVRARGSYRQQSPEN